MLHRTNVNHAGTDIFAHAKSKCAIGLPRLHFKTSRVTTSLD